MAKTLEDFTREIASTYSGSQGTLQKQLDDIEGNLATTKDQINRDYTFQQSQLMKNANDAASAASIRAAGNGGSFGGAAAIANQKYYDQTFVPAQINLSNARQTSLENADTNANDRRTSLEGQLASLQDTIAQAAYNQFYTQQEADRQYELQQQQLALQKQQVAAENAYNQYMIQAAKNQNSIGSNYSFNTANGQTWVKNNGTGQNVRLATAVSSLGGDFNDNLRRYISSFASEGNQSAQYILSLMNSGVKFAKNSGNNFQSTGNTWYDEYGIKPITN